MASISCVESRDGSHTMLCVNDVPHMVNPQEELIYILIICLQRWKMIYLKDLMTASSIKIQYVGSATPPIRDDYLSAHLRVFSGLLYANTSEY